MEFTPRIKQILLIMLNSEEAVSEQSIADKIGVSKRTIQREFEYIERSITEYKLNLEKKKNAGVWLCGSAENKEILKETLYKIKRIDFTDKDKRRKFLIFELLRENIPRKLYYFGNKFEVSEATISGDLEAINGWLNENHIEIIKKPGYGVVLNGSEKNYRRALQNFISENVNDEEVRLLLNNDTEALAKAIGDITDLENICELLNSEILGRVGKIFKNIKYSKLNLMTDNSYIALIIHTTIALDRILKGEIIEENKSLISELEIDDDYELAEKIIENLEREFEISIPRIEMAYIMLHIKGSKLNYTEFEDEDISHMGAEGLIDIIDEMIDVFEPETAYALKCDEEFIHGLILHLEPTIIRLKNEMNIYNPLLAEIKKEYSDIYGKCKAASKAITKHTGLYVNAEEIGYLTMHFGAALVKLSDRKRSRRIVEIGVICASGFGVARLMMTKIKNQLNQKVSLNAYGRDDITQFIVSKTDFFISSMNIDSLGVDYVYVSPLITASNLQQIEIKVAEYSHMPAKMKNSDFTRQLDEINFTASQIKNLIKKYKSYEIKEDVDLNAFLDEITFKITKGNKSANLLKNDLMEREHIMTQVFPEMEFALFHCKTEAVKEPAFYTCRPSSGNCFTSAYMKNVKSIIILLMPRSIDGRRSTELLGHISGSLVEDTDFLDEILRGDEQKIRSNLQRILKNYFNSYINKI